MAMAIRGGRMKLRRGAGRAGSRYPKRHDTEELIRKGRRWHEHDICQARVVLLLLWQGAPPRCACVLLRGGYARAGKRALVCTNDAGGSGSGGGGVEGRHRRLHAHRARRGGVVMKTVQHRSLCTRHASSASLHQLCRDRRPLFGGAAPAQVSLWGAAQGMQRA